MASFGAQPCGKCHFCTLLRYFSLMCSKHTAPEMPCSASEMAISLRPEFVLTGPSLNHPQQALTQSIALVAPLNSEGDVLLLKRDDAQHCSGLWSFPGGKIKTGENPETAAKRELKEETALTGSNWKYIGTHSFAYPDRLLHFYLFSCVCDNATAMETGSAYIWAGDNELTDYPMPDANYELISMLMRGRGGD